jgi:hypothetical protein
MSCGTGSLGPLIQYGLAAQNKDQCSTIEGNLKTLPTNNFDQTCRKPKNGLLPVVSVRNDLEFPTLL